MTRTAEQKYRTLEPPTDVLQVGDEFAVVDIEPRTWHLIRRLTPGEKFSSQCIYRRPVGAVATNDAEGDGRG